MNDDTEQPGPQEGGASTKDAARGWVILIAITALILGAGFYLVP